MSLWLLASPTVAHADPIVISSGVAIGNPQGAGVSHLIMNVQGPEFSFNGGPIGGFLANIRDCLPCADDDLVPSAVVDLGATLNSSGFDDGTGTGLIEGVTYPQVHVRFSSGTITTPTTTLTELGESLVELPFSFTAVMNGYLEHQVTRPSDAPLIFTVELTGSGRASASFFGLIDETSPDGRSFSLTSLMQYEFVQPQPQPVPEPGTLFLLGGAIAALAAWRSLRSRRRQRVGRLVG